MAVSAALPAPGTCLEMPPIVAENEIMRECWEWTVGDSTRFSQDHIPMLTSLVWWWAVARQCMANVQMPGQIIVTQIQTPNGLKQEPDLKTLREATNQIRQLSAELGIGPLAQTRMGLMRVATATMATELPARIFKMIDSADGN